MQWLFRNDTEADCPEAMLVEFDHVITREDKDILESTDPDALVDTRRRGVEYSMDSDRPGMLIRKKLMELLARHGEAEVHRGTATMAGMSSKTAVRFPRGRRAPEDRTGFGGRGPCRRHAARPAHAPAGRARPAAKVRVVDSDDARLTQLCRHAAPPGRGGDGHAAAADAIRSTTCSTPCEGPPLLLVLDGVTDPHNLGACLRVADGAGVHAVVAPKDHAVGLNATVAKVASGAAETVPYLMVTNLARTLNELKERDILVVGTSDDAPITLYEADLKGAVALVLGAEGKGLRQLTRKTCDVLVRIPMLGAVESLNVSVASGVCLYEARRQRGG